MTGLRSLDAYQVGDLKRVYRVLHGALPAEPELMDSELLAELQTWLQQRAAADGVDVSLHADWAAWLAAD